MTGSRDFSGTATGVTAREQAAYAETSSVADLFETILMHVREETDVDAATDVDIGAKGAGDDETLDLLFGDSLFAQEHFRAGTNGSLGQLHGAYVVLGEMNAGGQSCGAHSFMLDDIFVSFCDAATSTQDAESAQGRQGIKDP